MSTAAPTRPAMRYHGGKWKLAPWIISQFPPHRTYVEPFCGAASVLLRKPRAYSEVLNDMDGEVVNLFLVLRERGPELAELLRLTPFSRDEYRAAFQRCADPVERARRSLIRSYQGFGSNSINYIVNSGFRSNSNRSSTTPAHDWANFPACVPAIVERLRGVVIENLPAEALFATHDSPGTLFYLDPPYVHSTRTNGAGLRSRSGYAHEMSDADHERLAELATACVGMVALSGYRCELYERLYTTWSRVDCDTHADGARDRVESLWLNAAAVAAHRQPSLLPDPKGTQCLTSA